MKRAISDNNIISSETIALRSVSDQYNGINVDRMICSRSFSPDFFSGDLSCHFCFFLDETASRSDPSSFYPGTRRQ